MKKDEIVARVKSLNFPKDSFVVYGSCPLAVAGLREANDIDLLVSQELFDQLKEAGWRQMDKGPKDKPLTYDVFEAHANWDFSAYNPTLEQLLARATRVDGISFASLEDVRKWKAAPGTPKAFEDIKLIDAYHAFALIASHKVKDAMSIAAWALSRPYVRKLIDQMKANR